MKITFSFVCTLIISFLCLNKVNGQNPFLEAKSKSLEISSRINNYEEAYTFAYNKYIPLSKEYTSKANEYNDLYASKVKEKGEFEKQSDYNRRAREKEKTVKNLYDEIINMQGELKELGRICIDASNEWRSSTYDKYIYDSLSVKNQLSEKMTTISTYNSESEYFNLSFINKEYKVDIPLENAKAFKSNYTTLEVYKFGTDNWLEYEKEWHRLIDQDNPSQYVITLEGDKKYKYIEKLFNKFFKVEDPIFPLPTPSSFIKQPFNYANTVLIGGREYKTIRFGNQMWLAEIYFGAYNRNGKKLSFYSKKDIYKLERELESTDWKIPSKSDWDNLINFFENTNDANKKMYAEFPGEKEQARSIHGGYLGLQKIPTTYWANSWKSDTKAYAAHATHEKLDIDKRTINTADGYGSSSNSVESAHILLVRKF